MTVWLPGMLSSLDQIGIHASAECPAQYPSILLSQIRSRMKQPLRQLCRVSWENPNKAEQRLPYLVKCNFHNLDKSFLFLARTADCGEMRCRRSNEIWNSMDGGSMICTRRRQSWVTRLASERPRVESNAGLWCRSRGNSLHWSARETTYLS